MANVSSLFQFKHSLNFDLGSVSTKGNLDNSSPSTLKVCIFILEVRNVAIIPRRLVVEVHLWPFANDSLVIVMILLSRHIAYPSHLFPLLPTFNIVLIKVFTFLLPHMRPIGLATIDKPELKWEALLTPVAVTNLGGHVSEWRSDHGNTHDIRLWGPSVDNIPHI